MVKKELTVTFCGLELGSPLVVGASGLTRSLDQIKTYEAMGAGAIVTKMTVAKHPCYSFDMRTVIEPGLGWHLTGDERLSAEEGQMLIRSAKREVKCPIIANMMGAGTNAESWADLATMLVQAGADMLELNLSCPNVGGTFENRDGSQLAGVLLLHDLDSLEQVIQAVTTTVDVPVLAKISSDISDVVMIAEICVRAGVSGITAINASLGLPGVDIFNDGRPFYRGMDKQPFVAYAGPWLRPRSYRCIAEIAMRMDIPISASGGLMTWKHAVEAIMLGATTVQVCTAIFWGGPNVIQDFVEGLRGYVEELALPNLEVVRRNALKYLTSADRVNYATTANPHTILEVEKDQQSSFNATYLRTVTTKG